MNNGIIYGNETTSDEQQTYVSTGSFSYEEQSVKPHESIKILSIYNQWLTKLALNTNGSNRLLPNKL